MKLVVAVGSSIDIANHRFPNHAFFLGNTNWHEDNDMRDTTSLDCFLRRELKHTKEKLSMLTGGRKYSKK